MSEVKEVLLKTLSEIKDDKVGLLLSGGSGSASVLFALLDLGKEIHAYTFHMEGYESTDLKKARELALKFDIEFTPIALPSDLEVIKKDCVYLINTIGCSLKTDIECGFPIKYTLGKVKEKVLISALGDDDFFGTTKKAMIYYRNDLELLDLYREKMHKGQLVQCDLFQKIADEYSIKMFSPYVTKEMFELFKGVSWDEINKPKMKQWIIDTCPEEFTKSKFYYANYQKGDSKIADTFSKLLESDWNIRDYKSVTGIYNSIRRGEIK